MAADVAKPGAGQWQRRHLLRRFGRPQLLGALRQQWLQMSQNQAPGNGNGGTCYGDSGGPNFWVQPDGSEVLVSITSWGDIPCVSTNITQRTDSASAVEFLADVMD